jgi:TolB-like protein
MSLFNELKRRNVIRVGMAYLAGAWLILQVADTVIPWLGLDDATGRILLIALLVGFVPVVIAAWLFEWTADGIRFDNEVEVDTAGSVVASRRMDRIIIGILAVAVVYFAVDKFLFDDSPISTGSGDRSIAVLPFEDVSPGGDQGYLANGIADELRLELQHLEGLRVAGRTSSNLYAREDIKQIGDVLNVESILEGSIRQDGTRVRITVQLTNAADGFTIWSESYDRDLDRIFEMQEEIATSVGGSLGVRLGVGGVNAFRGAGTQSVEAYEAYLQAQGIGSRNIKRAEAIALLERAIELDPNYAAAWSWLAGRTLQGIWFANEGEATEIVEKAHQLALRGMQLNPESVLAQTTLAAVLRQKLDWVGAERAHRRAIQLLADRQYVGVYARTLLATGRIAYAKEQFTIAQELEPLGGRPVGRSWHTSLAQGRIEEARANRYWREEVDASLDNILDNIDIAFNVQDPQVLKAAIQVMPKTESSYVGLYGPLLAEIDSPERVLSLLESVYLNESMQWPRKLHDIAMAAAYFGDPQFALQAKRDEVRINSARLAAVWYPVMSDVRQLPGFKDLVTELNLVEYWRAYGWADACAPLGDNDFNCS